MPKRKGITKRIRFEVFKRDKFTCQYCGQKSPEVILEIDHVIPVSKGGEDTLLNYLTACYSCNSGKSDKLLSDDSLVDKQRKQIEELQERKNQIEMMLEWKLELSRVDESQYEKVIEYINSKGAFFLTEIGEKKIKELVKKYGAINVIEATDESFDKYYWGTGNSENWEFTFDKIRSICYFNSLPPDKKDEKERTAKTLRLVKNRFYSDWDYKQAIMAMNSFIASGGTPDQIDDVAKTSSDFYEWKNQMYNGAN